NSTAVEQNFFEKILDADGYGSIVHDVAAIFLDSDKKEFGGGISAMLNGLVGK
ncbi:MAG: hypothetical protein ACJAYY_002604, partial [Paraglaciecola sp.]